MSDAARESHLPAWSRRSLQRRFALISGGLLLLTSLIFLFLVTTGYRDRILSAHEQASTSVNLLLQAALENAMIKRDLDGLQDIIIRLGEQDGIEGVMIVNPDGEVRFSSYPERLFTPFNDPAFALALQSQQPQTGFRTLQRNSEVLRSVNPVHNKPECRECHGDMADNPVNGLLVVDYESSGVRKETRIGVFILGALGIVVLLTMEVGLWVAVRHNVIDRINNLERSTKRIADGELSERAESQGEDEIARLGRSFNDMAGRLERTLTDLTDSQAFLQELIDAIPDGVRVIDSDFRIQMANQAYCAQIGTDPERVIGQFCYQSSHKRRAPCVATLVECPVEKCVLGDGAPFKCSHKHVTDAGDNLQVEVFAAPATVTIGGKTARVVVESIRDLEAQLNISHEQRLSEMGVLAAGVAHEVHNPLSSIALALKSLAGEVGSNPKVAKYIDIAEAEIANCQAITESLLRLAAPGQQAAELVPMSEVIADTVSLLSYEAEQSGIKVDTRIDGAPRVLAGDSDMRILVFNLLHNAIHAMPNGGTALLSCRVDGDEVVFQIKDTGIGIAPRNLSRVLLPFWTKRADGTRGRGLGLSIVKSIVDRLGGHIFLESAPEAGTCFTISLPNADEAQS